MTNSSALVEENPQEQDEVLEAYCLALSELVDRKDLKLPVLPEIPSKVLAMTTNPEMNISELSELIHQDQALAGHVLRVGNSPIYAGSRQIASLTQAITRLGARLVGDIAFSISLGAEVFRVKGFEKVAKDLWQHALASGLYGKEIARMRRRNIEGQYLCGLLHTIGKPVILQAAVELQSSLDLPLTKDVARQLMDDFHATVGSILTFSWGLPEIVSKTCLYYQEYEEAPSYRDETIATYLSGLLARLVTDPKNYSAEEVSQNPAFAALNLYPDDIQALLDRSEAVAETLGAIAV